MSAYFPCIGFDARLWRQTAIGRYIRNITPRLRGIDLVVWVMPEDREAAEAALPDATVRVCPVKPFSLRELVFWRRELREVPVDLFHAPHINIPVVAEVPLVVTVHDLLPLRFGRAVTPWLSEKYFSMMSSLASARASRVIAVSDTTSKDLVALLDTDPAKIRIVGEGADPCFGIPTEPEFLQEVQRRYDLQGKYIIHVGQWRRHKNLETLLQAFAQLRRRSPELKLVLVGKEDPLQHDLPRLIGSLGLERFVVRTGYVTDEAELAGLYQGASALAYPSRYEGCGLPVLEAMASGVPVVSSNAAALPEVVGQAGMLVPPDDVNQWAAALDRALHDNSLRCGLIQAGYERSLKLTWDRAAAQTLATYNEVLGATLMTPSPARATAWQGWFEVNTSRSSYGT